MAIVKGKTKSGFKFEVETEVFKSWDFTRALADIQNKKIAPKDKLYATIKAVEITLGVQGVDALNEHLESTLPEEERVGGVPAQKVLEEFREIFEKASGSEKNS